MSGNIEAAAVKYQVVNPFFQESYLPEYKTSGAAGMDLHACIAEPVVLEPQQRLRIPTGIAIQLPGNNMVGLVYARSGIAWRHGIGLPNGVGVIDSDYTGEIQVLLTNFSADAFTISPGDRIAQLVFAPVFVASLCQVHELEVTERGSAGFGSTGVKLTRE